MTEQQIQTKIIKYLQSQNIYHFKVVVGNRSGIPDLVACVDGAFLGIEVKAERGVISKLQHYNAEKITESLGYFVFAHSLQDVIESIELIRRKS